MINNLRPTHILGIGARDLPHVGDLTKPYFITIGCSYSSGFTLQYQKGWCSRLADKLGLEHINLSFNGSSLEYQYEKITMAEDILKDALFVVWMQTHPFRTHKMNWRWLLGDVYSRVLYNLTSDDPRCWEKVRSFFDLVKSKKILCINSWSWDKKLKMYLDAKICKKNKQYFFNDNEVIDYSEDDYHPGPKSHTVVSDQLYNHIQTHFPHWTEVGND
mgnify:CR=1 FL=1|tara:strand:+ start:318 stop:968 length:651 start_codon:yes stop_codon:yes gene_type:complete